MYKYFLNKRNVAKVLFDSKYISPFTEYWGVWNDEQVQTHTRIMEHGYGDFVTRSKTCDGKTQV